MKGKDLPARNQSRSSGAPRIATLLLAVLLSCVTTGAFAYNFYAVNDDGVIIYYNYINDNKEAEVTYERWGVSSYSGDVTIPTTVTAADGMTLNVTSIGEYAFDECLGLTSVTIPNSVTSIGSYTFGNCIGLTSVSIPDGVTSIGEYAFSSCTKLISVTIGNSVTSIGNYAFYYCSNLTSITIPDNVTSIGNGAFAGCTGLTSIEVNTGNANYRVDGNCLIETASNTLIRGCNLSSVTIPDGVTSIGVYAFGDCSSLASVSIPNSVTSIGSDAFSQCSSLASVSIPNSVTSIGSYAFYYCKALTSVSIPNSVTSIGNNAFYYCKALTTIDIPNSVESIGSYAFSQCSSLASVSIPNSVESIGSYAFSQCSSLASVSIPNSVTSIGSYTFSQCSSLASVSIGSSVASIGNYAFSQCSSLASVSIPNSVTSIGNYAFWKCTGLTEVTLQGSVLPTCGADVFYNVDLTKATLYCPIGLEATCSTTEPWSSFGSRIGSIVTLADGERLSKYITEDNKSTVTKLKIYGEINSEDITLMKEMATSEALSVIDMSEATAATINLIGEDAFRSCTKLTSISLPKDITSIGYYAFASCSSLTSVNIPDGVTGILACAFVWCPSLTSVNIPDGVTNIGGNAFAACKSLTSVTIPNSVTSIGDYAFSGCSGLTSVTIPNSVTSIGKEAFYGCTGLTEVTLQGKTLPTCGYSVFNNVTLSNATLYCKAALVETCQSTDPWDDFGTIKAKPFSITISDAGIATGCFDDDLDFSDVEGVKAYIVSAFSPTEGQVLLTRATKIPAETGFIVKGSAGTYTIPAIATDYVYSNMLVGVLEATTVAKTDGTYTNYVLVNDATNGVGFYVAGNNTVPANKAYLQIPTSAVTTGETSDAKASLSLSFDDADDTTGIIQTREQSGRASGNAVIYNLNGQRKQSLTKGLNIVNGKKIFVK